MMLNVENVDENNKDLQIRFIARFFDNTQFISLN